MKLKQELQNNKAEIIQGSALGILMIGVLAKLIKLDKIIG